MDRDSGRKGPMVGGVAAPRKGGKSCPAGSLCLLWERLQPRSAPHQRGPGSTGAAASCFAELR
ncbi:hypothetical protein GCM10007164_26390 [Luteimonas padinae]|nr:hypothetical protein GCM10007164_26390 [Luteimonas padinae]